MFVMCSLGCDAGTNEGSKLNYEELAWLEKVGMKLYEGQNPPNIEGSYYLDSLTIAHDDLGLDHFIHEYTYTFKRDSSGDLVLSYAGPQAGDRADELPVRIYGSNKCFTVVADVEATSNGCHYKMSQVVSGCMTSNGIADFQLGIVMGNKSGTNCEDMLNEDHRRIINEEDGMAEHVK